jgi:hypothetical protein
MEPYYRDEWVTPRPVPYRLWSRWVAEKWEGATEADRWVGVPSEVGELQSRTGRNGRPGSAEQDRAEYPDTARITGPTRPRFSGEPPMVPCPGGEACRVHERCPECAGQGFRGYNIRVRCEVCGASGWVVFPGRTGNG